MDREFQKAVERKKWRDGHKKINGQIDWIEKAIKPSYQKLTA